MPTTGLIVAKKRIEKINMEDKIRYISSINLTLTKTHHIFYNHDKHKKKSNNNKKSSSSSFSFHKVLKYVSNMMLWNKTKQKLHN